MSNFGLPKRGTDETGASSAEPAQAVGAGAPALRGDAEELLVQPGEEMTLRGPHSSPLNPTGRLLRGDSLGLFTQGAQQENKTQWSKNES